MTKKEIEILEQLIELKIEQALLTFSSKQAWEIGNDLESLKRELSQDATE